MKYQIDHDLHIHSQISPCSRDENQTKEAIFAYGMTLGLKLLCVTDHFWDLQVDFKGYPVLPTWAMGCGNPFCRFLREILANSCLGQRWI